MFYISLNQQRMVHLHKQIIQTELILPNVEMTNNIQLITSCDYWLCSYNVQHKLQSVSHVQVKKLIKHANQSSESYPNQINIMKG